MWVSAVLLVMALAGWATPAFAKLTLCNRTSYILYAATAAVSGSQSDTRGWTRIVPGDCQVARNAALTARSYLVYARSSLGHSGPPRAWGGNLRVCVKDTDFVLRGSMPGSVCAGDTFARPFAAVDTQGKPNWTMTFDERPPWSSLIAAQLAGLKRLLIDNGYKISAIDDRPDKQTGAALADFRKRTRLSPAAGNADLFKALEDRARKSAMPTGYTVCNDTGELLLVALAQVAKGKAAAHGWWKIESGACARAITTPLTADAVFLLAQNGHSAPAAGGSEKFCIAAIRFNIRGRGDCVARGFSEGGFARTATRGHSGYVARIDKRGLEPQAGMLK
jgi:uncharacterized membrane protein